MDHRSVVDIAQVEDSTRIQRLTAEVKGLRGAVSDLAHDNDCLQAALEAAIDQLTHTVEALKRALVEGNGSDSA